MTLKLNNVSYRYPHKKEDVLIDISATFEPGKFYAIFGKPKSGKTTLVSLLTGLDVARSGDVSYNDQTLRTIDRDAYRLHDVGVVREENNALLHLTSVENIMFAHSLNEDNALHTVKAAYTLLERVGISRQRADHIAQELSDIELQKVALARILAYMPSIVIVDELLTETDDTTIITLLQSLAHDQNCTVVVATQSRQVAKQADEIWGINNGRLTYIK